MHGRVPRKQLHLHSRLRAKYRKRTRTVTCSAEEAYLREDVRCGCEACAHCGPPAAAALAADAPAYLMPDAEVLGSLLEVFELPDVSNWILLTSVLQRLSRTAGSRVQARVRALYKDKRRRCYLFDDLHCMFTSGSFAEGAEGLVADLAPSLLHLAHPSSLLAGPDGSDSHSQQQGQAPAPGPVQLQGRMRQLQRLLVAASFYQQHLEGRVPVVVVTAMLSPETAAEVAAAGTDGAAGAVAAQAAGAAAGAGGASERGVPEAEETDIDELLQLLAIDGPGGTPQQAPGRQQPPQPALPSSSTPPPVALASPPPLPPLPWPPGPGIHVVSPEQCFSPAAWGSVSSAVSDLMDSLLQARQAAEAERRHGGSTRSGSALYPPHLSQESLEEGLASGQLLQGKLHVSRRNPREAVVQVGSGSDASIGRMIHVSGRTAMNRAIDGDVVAVRLLPEPPKASATPSSGPAPSTASAAAPATGSGAHAAQGTDAGDEDEEAAAQTSGTDAEVLSLTAVGAAGAGAEEMGMGEEAEGGGGGDGGAAGLDAGELEALPAGEVVAVLQRDDRDVVACLSLADEAALRAAAESGGSGGGGGGGGGLLASVLCVPLDRRLPLVRVRARAGAGAARLLGQRLVLRVDGWERGSRWPSGHVVRVLGRTGDLAAESEAVLVQCGIRWQPFCHAALMELPQVRDASEWQVPPLERLNRRDLTGTEYFVCSIDPPGCTDVDDALHVRLLPPASPVPCSFPSPGSPPTRQPPRGTRLVEVGVHIADVSYFVAAGGMLDGEARDRCTTVYLVDRRLDMLPALLSEQLCSLRSGVERLAVSVIWTLRLDSLEVLDVWMGRTLIRSRHQLTYAQAQNVLDGKPRAAGEQLPADDTTELRSSLQVLTRLTDQLRGVRQRDGALELAGTEMRFKLDAQGQPVAVDAKAKLPMMDLIAEMMIWANAEVAARIASVFPGCALLRNHPPPRGEAFDKVRHVLEPADTQQPSDQQQRQQLDPSSNVAVSRALAAACRAARDPGAAQLIRSLLTQAMSEAKYFSTGSAAPGSAGAYHYGLALKRYTHFTSPIRRYADVVVHRQLLAALQLQQQQQQAAAAAAPTATSDALEPPPAASVHVAPPMEHAELSAAAHVMNERHRTSKAAQKECGELFMLELLHKSPHVESALVVGVQDRFLEVFLPKYQIRGRLQLQDAKGLVRLPLESEEELQAPKDAFSDAALRPLRLRSPSPSTVEIADTRTNAVLWSTSTWQRVWVRLAADGGRAHGPRLDMRLVADCHPLVPKGEERERAGGQGQGPAVGLGRGREGGVVVEEAAPGPCPAAVGLPPVLAAAAAAAAAAKARPVAVAAGEPNVQPDAAAPLMPALGTDSRAIPDWEAELDAAAAHVVSFQPSPLASDGLTATAGGSLAAGAVPGGSSISTSTSTSFPPVPTGSTQLPAPGLSGGADGPVAAGGGLHASAALARVLACRLARCQARLAQASLGSSKRPILRQKLERLMQQLGQAQDLIKT